MRIGIRRTGGGFSAASRFPDHRQVAGEVGESAAVRAIRIAVRVEVLLEPARADPQDHAAAAHMAPADLVRALAAQVIDVTIPDEQRGAVRDAQGPTESRRGDDQGTGSGGRAGG
jgi:hypothetical protein